MNEELEWKTFIDKTRDSYYKIVAVPCPAFQGEDVYFNRYGWNHLIRKNGQIRSIEQQKRRLLLLPYAVEIIRTSTQWKEYRGEIGGTEFWSFNKKFGDLVVTVIVRRDIKQKYFFSIMD